MSHAKTDPVSCQACQARGKTWEGSDPRCAFSTGVFDKNWNCATANRVRDLCERKDDFRIHHCREENQQYATVSLLEFDVIPHDGVTLRKPDQPVCLWVGWYKQRGATEAMWLMFDIAPPRKPTEAECLKILELYAEDGE